MNFNLGSEITSIVTVNSGNKQTEALIVVDTTQLTDSDIEEAILSYFRNKAKTRLYNHIARGVESPTTYFFPSQVGDVLDTLRKSKIPKERLHELIDLA